MKIGLMCFVIVGILLNSAAIGSGFNHPISPQKSKGEWTKAPGDAPKAKKDLTGAYSGEVKMTGAYEMSGEGEITISGELVTIVAGGSSCTGRIDAVGKKGYIGVTIQLTGITDPATGAELVVMARGAKKGDRLILTPEPNARNTISFK